MQAARWVVAPRHARARGPRGSDRCARGRGTGPRVHPIAVLNAIVTYDSNRSRGGVTWERVRPWWMRSMRRSRRRSPRSGLRASEPSSHSTYPVRCPPASPTRSSDARPAVGTDGRYRLRNVDPVGARLTCRRRYVRSLHRLLCLLTGSVVLPLKAPRVQACDIQRMNRGPGTGCDGTPDADVRRRPQRLAAEVGAVYRYAHTEQTASTLGAVQCHSLDVTGCVALPGSTPLAPGWTRPRS